jgi:peptide/nickel transport system permease protein
MSNAPGDPADTLLNQKSGDGQATDKIATDQAYRTIRRQLGLDKPMFYFTISSVATCDTLNNIDKSEHRDMLARMTDRYGNWPKISGYYDAAVALDNNITFLPKDSTNTLEIVQMKDASTTILRSYDDVVIDSSVASIARVAAGPQYAMLRKSLDRYNAARAYMKSNPTKWKTLIPTIHWNGFQNQYHKWLFGNAPWFGEAGLEQTKGFIRGDFGTSFFDKRPVKSIIWDHIGWTLLISFFAILITYLISIPLGIFSALRKDTAIDQSLTTFLFILYSLPVFWIATMLIFFLCGGDYLSIFPPTFMGDVRWEDGFFLKIGDLAYHMILPVFAATYGTFAYMSRQMRGGMLTILRTDYIRTARAKGLPQSKIVWKHAFRNSLLPVITIFASILPALVSGSVIIEFIFTIPGMGQLGYQSVIQKDYPMVLTVTMFSAILTLIGYLVSDILYAVVDPRISYSKK